jgi:hypothetical protein
MMKCVLSLVVLVSTCFATNEINAQSYFEPCANFNFCRPSFDGKYMLVWVYSDNKLQTRLYEYSLDGKRGKELASVDGYWNEFQITNFGQLDSNRVWVSHQNVPSFKDGKGYIGIFEKDGSYSEKLTEQVPNGNELTACYSPSKKAFVQKNLKWERYAKLKFSDSCALYLHSDFINKAMFRVFDTDTDKLVFEEKRQIKYVLRAHFLSGSERYIVYTRALKDETEKTLLLDITDGSETPYQ